MSSIGKQFKVTTYGESHGKSVGVIIEGFPSNFKVDIDQIQENLNRRRPGQSNITTQRKESDVLQIQSGLQDNISLGSPIGALVNNLDVKKQDYDEFSQVPRPGHGDFTYQNKYGIKSQSGGGRSSARETISRVIAGSFAQQYLSQKYQINIVSWVSQIGNIKIPQNIQQDLVNDIKMTPSQLDKQSNIQIYKNIQDQLLYKNQSQIFFNNQLINEEQIDLKLFQLVEEINTRCPHFQTSIQMIELIKIVKQDNDSIGGVITCVCTNMPIGLGEPCFDKIQAQLAHAMMSIPATKGFEYGSGFEGVQLRGSQHNDLFYKDKDQIKTKTNNAGGVLAGITNGQNIYFKVAFKPVSTIGKPQNTCDFNGKDVILEAKGRHDPCVLPRAPPIVDAMANIVIMDFLLLQQIQWYNR